MKIACLIVLFTALAASVVAGSYQIVYQEQIEGAEGYSDIDPILTDHQECLGYTYADPYNKQIIVDRLMQPPTTVTFSHSWWILSDNYISGDTLFVYAGHGPYFLSRSVIIGDSVSTTTIEVGRDFYHYSTLIELDFHLERTGHQATAVVYERSDVWMDIVSTMGIDSGRMSLSLRYELDLSSRIRSRVSMCRSGDLSGGPEHETVSINNFMSYRYYGSDDPDDPNSGEYYDIEYLETSVSSPTGERIYYSRSADPAQAKACLVDQFLPYTALHQVILYGISPDLTGQHPSTSWHVACYSFASGAPEELWYTPLSGVSLDYVYKPQHFIAGMRGQDKAVMLNYWTGQLCDSIDLDRNLTATTFFETGSDPSVLNLVGRNYDTVFVYQFQTPTDAPTEPSESLPVSFSLDQNYPNPFNGGTVIGFHNSVRQKMTLIIYNVLGQEVAEPYGAETLPGEFSATWNGLDAHGLPVASGVYFARLSSPTESRLIKMLFLK